MKMIDPTLKFITFQNKGIDNFDQFLIDEKSYTETFTDRNKDSKYSRNCISFKMNSSKYISEIKHVSSSNLSKKIKTFVDNNAFITQNKYRHHREHSIGFFTSINPKITPRESLRKSIHDHIIWMDIDDKENESLVKNVLEKDGSWKGKQNIVIFVFDLHNKEVGHGNGIQRVITIVYKICTSTVNVAVLKIVNVKFYWIHQST